MDNEFKQLLKDFSPETLHQCDQTVFAMRTDLTLAYVNTGWETFAALNGESEISSKWPLGRCVSDAMTTSFRTFFETSFATCLKEMRPWGHRYDCSSPQVFREFKMLVYPLGVAQGFLVVNSPVVCVNDAAKESFGERYRGQNGLITQCCQCKRFQNTKVVGAWEWVPEWSTACPQNTSHGLCQTCFGFYYSSSSRISRKPARIFHTHE